MISPCMWKATSKNSNFLNYQFLASIIEICQSTGLTITRAFGYLTTLIQRYRLHIRHEDAHECWTDKNFKDAAALHGGTSGWRHLRKQQITDRRFRNMAEIQQVIPPNKTTVSTRKQYKLQDTKQSFCQTAGEYSLPAL
jgi:hypothetical protein